MSWGIVISTIGELKKQCCELSETIDEVLFGMNVDILKDIDDKWYYIRTEYRYEGYILKSSILRDNLKAEVWNNTKNKIIKVRVCDILRYPDIKSNSMQTLVKGSYVRNIPYDEICGYEGGNVFNNLSDRDERFDPVILPDKRIGFVRREFLDDIIINTNGMKTSELREKIVKTAMEYMGTQYKWGGKTPLGIDCSGLCSMAYMINGINIYRDSDIKEGFPVKKIDIKYLKKADLIYFPGHIAMYIGNNRFIHASTRYDVVRINSLNRNDFDYDEKLAKSIIKCGSIFEIAYP